MHNYDDMEHLTSVKSANSTTTLQDLTYDWYLRPNTGGINIGEIVDHRLSAEKTVTGVNTDESQAYTYDDLYRLTQVVFPWGTKEYSGYNAIGNMTHKVLGSDSWDYTWTNENFLWKVSKNGVPTAEMTYDAWGQRAKKVYTGGGSNVTTLYFGKTFERRTYSNSATALHTIYIYANGQVIAQETVQGSAASAFNSPNRWRGEVAAASLYNGYNFKGAIQKVHHYLNAAALHPQSAQWVILVSFLLFVTGVLAMLVTSQLNKAVRRSSYSPALRWASLSVLMIFTLSACGGGSPGGGFYSSVGNQVGGNTLQGPSVGTFFYLRNQVNSTTVVTRDDGSEVSRHVYMPFGEMMPDHSSGGDAVTRKFTGQERDEETDLDYFNARYYDPAIGRFVSADTIIPDVMNGMAFNRYAYVLNSPVMHEDPTGHIAPLVALAIAWACVEFALSVYDAYTTASTLVDPKANAAEKAAASGGLLLGIFTFGGGYSKIGKEVTKEITDNVTQRAIKEGVENSAERGTQKLLNPPIHVTPEGLQHVVDRHTSSGIAKFAGKSKFNAGEDIRALIEAGTQQPMVQQANGRFARRFDVGREIGLDRTTGKQTSWMTIITESDGSLVTAFPGAP